MPRTFLFFLAPRLKSKLKCGCPRGGGCIVILWAESAQWLFGLKNENKLSSDGAVFGLLPRGDLSNLVRLDQSVAGALELAAAHSRKHFLLFHG
jgi:hypothetical protein